MIFRHLATIQGNQMGFFISRHFATVSIRHGLAVPSSFKTFFDQTFLKLRDFFCGHFIRCSNVSVCPTTGSISFE